MCGLCVSVFGRVLITTDNKHNHPSLSHTIAALMNTDEADEAIAAAAAAFALVVEQTQSAIAQARSAPSPATIALEAKCASLESTIGRLNKIVEMQRGGLRASYYKYAAERRDKEIATMKCAVLQTEVTELQRTRDSVLLQHRQLELAQSQLATDMDSLRCRQSRLDARETKLAADKDAALKNLKRSVADMEADMERDYTSRTGTTKRPTPPPLPRPAKPRSPGPSAFKSESILYPLWPEINSINIRVVLGGLLSP